MRQVGTCTLGPTVKAGLNHDGGAAAAGADGSLLHDARPPKVRLRNEDACDAKSTGQRWKLLLRLLIPSHTYLRIRTFSPITSEQDGVT